MPGHQGAMKSFKQGRGWWVCSLKDSTGLQGGGGRGGRVDAGCWTRLLR